MIRTLALTVVLCAAVTAAAAQEAPSSSAAAASPSMPTVSAVRTRGDIVLVPGRELVISWKMGAPPSQVSERESGGTPFAARAAPTDVETFGKVQANAPLVQARPGEIVFTLWADDKNGTTLLATSGQAEPFFYMANLILRRDNRLIAAPTTICAVKPGSFTRETWPERVEGIQIVGIGSSPDDMCYDHRAKKGYKRGEQPPSDAQQ